MTVETTRRALLRLAAGAGAIAGLGLIPPDQGKVRAANGDRALPAFFSDLERRTFNFFWERANPANGLVPDRWPSKGPSSIAAIGFGLTALVLGAERGWITRQQAHDRALLTIGFLAALPSGEQPSGNAGHRGFFYHFLDMDSGLRVGECELSTVDTALLHMGVLHVANWFDRADEAALRTMAFDLVDRAEWDWFQQSGAGIPMGWHPERGFIDRIWDGYNEGKMVYILALGSGRHPARAGSWQVWCDSYKHFWRGHGGNRRLAFAPMFGHQYSEMWIDFRGIYDAPMRAAGFDYFENSRRATLAQQAYCAANPLGWTGYDNLVWGLTACDGPGQFDLRHEGHAARYEGYSARGPVAEPDGFDDGTLAPTAVLGSVPFAPEICIPSALAIHRRHGSRIYDRYGFKDAFNPSFRDTTKRVENGTVDPVFGWVGGDYLGIDQGPILGMLANYRNQAVWKVMRRSPNVIRGLKRAGFTGGWLNRT